MGSDLGEERGFLCPLEILDAKWDRLHARMGLLLHLPVCLPFTMKVSSQAFPSRGVAHFSGIQQKGLYTYQAQPKVSGGFQTKVVSCGSVA